MHLIHTFVYSITRMKIHNYLKLNHLTIIFDYLLCIFYRICCQFIYQVLPQLTDDKRAELDSILEDFGQGCDGLYDIVDAPEELIYKVLDMFEETCSDVVDVDVDSMEESALKTIFQQLEPVCETMVELWEEVDDNVNEVNSFIYKHILFLMLMFLITMQLFIANDHDTDDTYDD